MIAAGVVLAAFPLGFLLRNRFSALVGYLAVHLYALTVQTGYLVRTRVVAEGQPVDAGPGYLASTAAVLVVGCCLVLLGHRAGSRLRSRRSAVDLDTDH